MAYFSRLGVVVDDVAVHQHQVGPPFLPFHVYEEGIEHAAQERRVRRARRC